jgi:hypothetical protein
VIAVIAVIEVIIAVTHHSGSSKSSSGSNGTPAPTGKASIYVVASKSECWEVTSYAVINTPSGRV